MRPIIDPGYGESLLQNTPEVQARHEEWVRQNRENAMRQVREILAKDPPQPVPTRWSDSLWFGMTLVLISMSVLAIGVLLLLASITSLFVSPFLVLAIPVISAIHMWIRRWIRRKPVAKAANGQSPKVEPHA